MSDYEITTIINNIHNNTREHIQKIFINKDNYMNNNGEMTPAFIHEVLAFTPFNISNADFHGIKNN